MIGDNLGSDIAAANGVCMDSVWIGPGGQQSETDNESTHARPRLSELLESPRSGRSAGALLLVLLSLAGCSAPTRWFGSELDGWIPRTTVTTEHVVLHSPYGATGTDHWAQLIDEEYVAVRRLYGVQHLLPLTVRMFPTPVGGKPEEPFLALNSWRNDRAYSVAGVARNPENGQANIALLVPESFAVGVIAESTLRPTLRHELSHAMSHLAVGKLPRFLTEGLATVVADLSTDVAHRARWNSLVNEDVFLARERASTGSLEQLLSWQAFDADGPDSWNEERARYGLSRSLVRFLLERFGPGRFRERVARVVAVRPGALRDLEGSWLEWLAGLDPYEDLARAMSSKDNRLRIEALRRMRSWSNVPQHQRSVERRFVELALAALHDKECFHAAALALIGDASAQLTQDDIAPLAESEEAYLFLLGQALLARRGEPLDRQTIERVWSRLDGPAGFGIPWPVLEVLGLEYGDLSGLFTRVPIEDAPLIEPR